MYNLPKYHKEYSQNIQHQLTAIDNSISKLSNQMTYSSLADTHCRYHQQTAMLLLRSLLLLEALTLAAKSLPFLAVLVAVVAGRS